MSDSIKTVLFATGLCLVCSLLLTMAATGLKAFQRENALVDRQKNILKAVGAVTPDRRYTSDEIKELYRSTIRCVAVGEDGEALSAAAVPADTLPLYLYEREGETRAYIIPVNSRGLWGRINGYLALEPDGSTIAGFTVYQHAETPGLGGEIDTRWFQQNFVGKKIVDEQGDFVSVRIAKGEVEDAVPADLEPHYVDGISGATLTGKYLSEGLEDILQTYEPVSVRFRHRGMLKLPENALTCQPPS